MLSPAQSFRSRWHKKNGYREILNVGLPLAAGLFSTTLMMFTDRIFLSHYSVDAIAAAVPAALANNSILFGFVGIVSYATVFIAQYIGSEAEERVGPALWQGLWLALLSSLIMASLCLVAEPLFAFAGHDPHVQELEVIYFSILCLGSIMCLLTAALSCFFTGRGQTRPVLVADVVSAAVKIPCDYLLIFGVADIIPPLGIVGAAISTIIAWTVSAVILAALIFTERFEKQYKTRSGWRFHTPTFLRLLRFGTPSGLNLFMDIVAFFWFSLVVGTLGKAALASTNIAFSLNNIIFMPALGFNFAVASLAGRAMGAGKPREAEELTKNSLHIAFAYMVPVAFLIAFFAGPLMDLFAPSDISAAEFIPVRETGIYLLYYIALYSLVDAGNVIFFGALKGVGDTPGVFRLLLTGLIFFLILPITVINALALQSVHTYWAVLTTYIFFLAFAAMRRFYRRKWHTIRVVETAKPVM